MSLFREHQLTVAASSASHQRSVITHLDGFTVARTTTFTFGNKEDAEDGVLEVLPEPSHGMETEFHGGEGVDTEYAEDELLDVAERSFPLLGALSVRNWSTLLSRQELEAAQRPGRKREETKQMSCTACRLRTTQPIRSCREIIARPRRQCPQHSTCRMLLSNARKA